MRRLRKGDDVVVTTGKDKGKRSTITKVISEERVIVDNVNVVKRHTRANPNQNQPGGIIEKEMPVDASNVMLWNPQTQKGDRVGFRFLEDGRKVRFFKSTNEVIDV
ncbi:MAG: 50S ribosomal protein L24 [Gammaproteobacteria bacterium]|nr:50S ribosomal protein L24 [Gammaproteobacteria bacterium]